jgi:hypothetical protein
LDARGGEAVGELHKAVHRRQVRDVVRDHERLDLFPGSQCRGVAGVVVAIAIGFIHLPHFAIADVARALLGGVEIGRRKDQLGTCQRGEVAGALLAINLNQFLEAVNAEDHGAAERARGLKAVLDCRQLVQRAELVEHEPGPQLARARHCHEAVDREVHPKRQQRPVHGQIDVVGGDEEDRPGLLLAGDPVPDRERLARVGKEAQDLRIGVEDGADRLRHARRFGRGQRVGDRVLEEAMDPLQIGGHQVLGERQVGRLAPLDQADAHLDEQGPRCERPERLGRAAIGGDESGGGGGELAVRAAVREDRPCRAATVHRIEDRVTCWVVEGLHIGTGQVEDHGAVLTLAHLPDQAPELGGLARAGRTDQHGVRLLHPVRKGDAGERVGMVDSGALARREGKREHLLGRLAREAFADVHLEGGRVMLRDLGNEDLAIDQHSAALVPLLQDRLATATREIDEPDRQGNGEEHREKQCAEKAAHGDAPGPLDLGHQRDHGHDRAVEFAARKPDVDALRRVEADPVPEHGVELHADELEAVLVQFERHDHEPGREEHEEPDDEGKFCAGEPHQQLVGQQLAAAGEIARVALDFSACGMVGQRDRPAIGADVVTRHGIAPGACRRWR